MFVGDDLSKGSLLDPLLGLSMASNIIYVVYLFSVLLIRVINYPYPVATW